ncbi:unnamed protein product [Phytophthora fragariaefolia]|uniref:Unnamed protein product n=1 Tax=Phytophthora fragariaefolia TaxID=1490495 RepID=A0A9W6X2T5_9STRA|nr:unnamed protein product [Phytophthora fragariaefolia]
MSRLLLLVILALLARIADGIALPARLHDINERGKRNLRADQLSVDLASEDRIFESITKIAGRLTQTDQKTVQKPAMADKMFKRYDVHKAIENLIESKQFALWSKAVQNKVSKRAERTEVELLKTLTTRYGNEFIANLIATAQVKGSSKAKTIADSMERAEIYVWHSDAKSVDDVFNLLKLDQAEGPILEKPALKTWLGFAKFMREDPYPIIFSKLKMRYGDDTLAQILVSAKGSRESKKLADKMDDLLFQSWRQADKSPDDIFKLLKLDGTEGNIFPTPEFFTWMSYLEKLDNTNVDGIMYAYLTKRYGEQGLRDMVRNSLESSTTRLSEIQKKEGKSYEELFKMEQLKLEIAKTKSVRARLTEEIWMKEGKTADDIFKMKKLDRDSGNTYELFDNPSLDVWASYAEKLHRVDNKNPDAISILEKDYGRLSVAEMLSTSRTAAVESLRDLQFKKWLSEGIHPDVISFHMTGFSSNVKVQVGYRNFYKNNIGRRDF